MHTHTHAHHPSDSWKIPDCFWHCCWSHCHNKQVIEQVHVSSRCDVTGHFHKRVVCAVRGGRRWSALRIRWRQSFGLLPQPTNIICCVLCPLRRHKSSSKISAKCPALCKINYQLFHNYFPTEKVCSLLPSFSSSFVLRTGRWNLVSDWFDRRQSLNCPNLHNTKKKKPIQIAMSHVCFAPSFV